MTLSPSISPASTHAWVLRFDRVCCRDCRTIQCGDDDDRPCKDTQRPRPVAGFRQHRDEVDRLPGYDVQPGSRIEAANLRAAAFWGDTEWRA
jgi:hypothetical protein